mgnify:CR=1 FL=1
MMQQLANFIVDHDPMMVLQRTHDTVRYIRWAWNKDHAAPIDEDEMRSVYEEMCVRLLQHEIMLERGMVPDVSTYRSVFCTEGGDAPWMLDQAG